MLILPPEIGESLGLGPKWQVLPLAYGWHRVDATTTDGPLTLHVLRMQNANGIAGYAFNDADLRRFHALAVHEASGLVIPDNTKGSTNEN